MLGSLFPNVNTSITFWVLQLTEEDNVLEHAFHARSVHSRVPVTSPTRFTAISWVLQSFWKNSQDVSDSGCLCLLAFHLRIHSACSMLAVLCKPRSKSLAFCVRGIPTFLLKSPTHLTALCSDLLLHVFFPEWKAFQHTTRCSYW